jgi:hypothetical protein
MNEFSRCWKTRIEECASTERPGSAAKSLPRQILSNGWSPGSRRNRESHRKNCTSRYDGERPNAAARRLGRLLMTPAERWP